MGYHYGQQITFGVLGAPALFTGDNMSFSYREQVTEDYLEDGGGDFAALALHSRKGEISFEGEVTSASKDFLDLSTGARISVAGSPGGIDLSAGLILAHEVVEEWNLLKRKRCSVRATHYPDAPADATHAAGKTLDVFLPSQAEMGILYPGGTLTYSTYGFGHASGIVHQVKLEQTLQITDDEPTPDGKLPGAFAGGYKRKLSLLLLASPQQAAIPPAGSLLALEGAPTRMSNFRVISAEPRLERKKALMFQIEAAWIPAMGSAA